MGAEVAAKAKVDEKAELVAAPPVPLLPQQMLIKTLPATTKPQRPNPQRLKQNLRETCMLKGIPMPVVTSPMRGTLQVKNSLQLSLVTRNDTVATL